MRKEERIRQQREREGERKPDRMPRPAAREEERVTGRESEKDQSGNPPREPGSRMPLPE